jgi:hypothetical protein
VDTLIAIETSRYSTVLRRILEAYVDGSEVRIDGSVFRGKEIRDLLANWCTNSRIKKTRNFLLSRDGRELFGFHDHPSELWAASSELQFVEALRLDGLARTRVLRKSR